MKLFEFNKINNLIDNHDIKNKSLDKFKHCLIGRAIGDTLGYPIEFNKVISKNNKTKK